VRRNRRTADAYGTYERAQSPIKEFRWLDTANHIDLYDNPLFVDPAIAWLAGCLTARLPAGARPPAV
jgi:hypothetical protein